MRAPIDGSTALVTGASSGIGRELARQLAPRVAKLIVVARRAQRLEALRDELEAAHGGLSVLVFACDLSDIEALDAMVDDLRADIGPIDLLINNAGLGDIGVFDLADRAKLDLMITVNVTALTHLTHRLVPSMVERGRGGVLNISSGFGLVFMPGVAVYVATKQYVTGFTESLRLDLRGTGVVVTQSCPGPVSTEFEAVAGNPTGRDVPGFVQITPEKCARASLKAFERGRAMCIPGFWIRLFIGLGRVTPRWLMRLMFAPLGPGLRRRQRAQLESESTPGELTGSS